MRGRERIRRVVLRPYARGRGPVFTLSLYEAAPSCGRERLGYRLAARDGDRSAVVFEGADFGPSPLHAHDSDEAVGALLTFLTLRPGDTDPGYFAGYTPAQRAFCDAHAEALASEAARRFGEERDGR